MNSSRNTRSSEEAKQASLSSRPLLFGSDDGRRPVVDWEEEDRQGKRDRARENWGRRHVDYGDAAGRDTSCKKNSLVFFSDCALAAFQGRSVLPSLRVRCWVGWGWGAKIECCLGSKINSDPFSLP